MTLKREPTSQRFLGIDGGGTRTVALMADGSGQSLCRLESGPANMKLLTDHQLAGHFRSIAKAMPCPDALGIGLSGAWVEPDFRKIRQAAAQAWPGVPCYATNDLETALTAAGDAGGVGRLPQVLLVSGTGSGAYGKTPDGKGIKVGGWGHLLGDDGSGYDIGLQALRAVVADYDRDRAWPGLGRQILRALALNEPTDLIDWAQAAAKKEIANLAVEVFEAWGRRDRIATRILIAAADNLARDAAACARRLAAPGTRVRFVLTGSILLKQPRFGRLVGGKLRKLCPGAAVTALKREGVWGAVELARTGNGPRSTVRSPQSSVHGLSPGSGRVLQGSPQHAAHPEHQGLLPRPFRRGEGRGEGSPEVVHPANLPVNTPVAVVRSARRSPTEQRNHRSMRLHKMGVREAIALMLSEDARIPRKLLAESPRIERVIRAVARAFRRGGRLFYVGAGTSGRLGVLDASECPPTFGTSPDLVQGINAGGQTALWSSVEGGEDDGAAGGRAMESRGVGERDVVVGIAASGTTPFVWGALAEAGRRGATTVLVCFNPFLVIPQPLRPSVVIAPDLGPEVLTGSTRLKAGTATKLLLNIFTTLAMVRFGKVRSNLMIDLNPANTKLRDRAARIVCDLTGMSYAEAEQALQGSGWVIKRAIARLGRKQRNPPGAVCR
ncbi:MAG: N-acetylmuramic acid 6-phosphate etherase [Verrucomicrobiota bacterium]